MTLTIPGVETLHLREAWEQPAYRVAALNPPRQIPVNITQPTAHYTAAIDLPDGDLGEFEYQIAPYLAAIQRDYWTDPRRGYSIGYLFAVDWLGGVWELRGFDYKSAANYGHNEYTAPILFLVDGADEATPLAVASAVAVWREFRRRSGRADFKTRPLGHGELFLTTGTGTPTACPGSGVLRQLHRGDLDLDQEDWTMRPHSERVLDTRPINKPLLLGDPREVPVGMATQALVRIQALDAVRDGYLSLDGGATSVVNYKAGQAIASDLAFVALDNGHLTLSAHGEAGCHVVVDVQGIG